MGVCASNLTEEQKKEREASKAIDRHAAEDFEQEKQKIKLLLLGAGESGKSTIFKQMKILYGVKYTDEERTAMKPIIYQNILLYLNTVIENMERLGEKPNAANTDLLRDFTSQTQEDEVIDAALGEKIRQIWADEGVQNTFAKRAAYQVQDALKYYCDDIVRLSQDSYIPNDQDILRARVRTSGIVEERYNIDAVNFCMYDVGGQRNERKKWIHCFDDVTAVIFVAAINEYDQMLYEDNTCNRIDEALNLFQEICNSTWFQNTSMILFLNKCDLFREKLSKVPFKLAADDTQPGRNFDYTGPDPLNPPEGMPEEEIFKACETYMKERFEAQNNHPATKEIYSHVTCATDTNNIRHVFDSCKDIILKGNLRGSGFMD